MGLKFDEFEVGKKYISARRTIREADIEQFAALSADYNPLHVDELYVKENTNYRQCIAHGALTFAMSTGRHNPYGDNSPGEDREQDAYPWDRSIPKRYHQSGWRFMHDLCRYFDAETLTRIDT